MARLLMEDTEWAFFEPFITGIRGRGGRPASKHRQVLDGIFRIARTGAQWRDLPSEFGKWSCVYRQFRRWTLAGLWDLIIDTLNESEAMPDQVQMIHWLDGVCEQTPRSDSTVIHAHHQTAGAKAFSVIDVKTLHAKIGELTLTNDAPQGLRGPTGATVPAAMSGALGKAGLLSRCPAGDCLAICRKGSAKR